MNFLTFLLAIFYTTQPLKVIYQNRAYYPVRSYSTEHSVWIRVSDFAPVLKFDVKYDRSTHKLLLQNPSHTIELYGDNPFVKVDGNLLNLPRVVKLRDGELFLSIFQLQYLFGEILGIDFIFEENRKEIRLYDRKVEINKIRLEERRDTTKLLLYTTAPLEFSAEGNTPGEVALTLFRSRMRKGFSLPKPAGLVKNIEITPKGEEVILKVSALNTTKVFFAKELRNPPGVSLILVGSSLLPKKVEEKYRKINRIVIDPGHGGKDPGAIGPSGLYEKDVNLQVSKLLKKFLEDRLGVEVIMTREDDSFVPLAERARIANESSADLFISIHCNAAPRWKKNSGGVETYFLSVAKTDEARAVEARENASIRFELDENGGYNLDDVSLILWDLAQNEFLEESERLAENVQEGLAKSIPIENRGISQAGFFVLNGVYMPSILVECAFISNKKEERLLKNRSFQRKLAEGIFRGVVAFKREYEVRYSSKGSPRT